jgi:ribosomal protein S21
MFISVLYFKRKGDSTGTSKEMKKRYMYAKEYARKP